MAGKLPPTPVGVPPGHSFWNDWYEKLRTLINDTTTNFTNLDFSGSNITSIVTRRHRDLQDLQGGAAGEYFHLTSAQQTALTAGFTGTGNIVRDSSPTLITPNIGNATATGLTVDTNTLFVDSANDRVGIGTITPQRKLDVSSAGDTRIVVRDSAANGWSFSASHASLGAGFGSIGREGVGPFIYFSPSGPVGFASQTIGTGAATPTLTANKPGANSGVSTWLTIVVNGTNYYLPLWT